MTLIVRITFVTTLGLLLCAACSNEATKTINPIEVSMGKVERIENFRSKFVTPRNVDVWLPKGYTPEEKYPVLYMHDGQMLFDATTTWNKQEWGVDEVMTSLIKAHKTPKTLVVGIWNSGKGRHSDYFPQKPFEMLPQTYQDSLLHPSTKRNDEPLFSGKVQSDNYLKFLTEELKPYIDKNYATQSDAAHTFIAGSSMGGLISMYALCEYPQVYGGAACLSTHWPGTFAVENNPIPGKFMAYLKENLPDPATHKFYFDYGTQTLDAPYEGFQVQADSIGRLRGYDTNNWQSLKFVGDDHSEKSWNRRLEFPLLFLLGDYTNN